MCGAEGERKWYNIPVNLKGEKESGSKWIEGAYAMKKELVEMPGVRGTQTFPVRGLPLAPFRILLTRVDRKENNGISHQD